MVHLATGLRPSVGPSLVIVDPLPYPQAHLDIHPAEEAVVGLLTNAKKKKDPDLQERVNGTNLSFPIPDSHPTGKDTTAGRSTNR